MTDRAREAQTRAVAAVALAFAVGAAVAGCASATATTGAPAAGPPAATKASAGAPADGPFAPDAACVAAEKAEQTLQSHQGQDQNNETALDQDFTNFATALTAAAQSERSPAAAQAMTALANDYTALVESQSGGAQLPDMSQVQKDGAAFEKACSQ
jgi:hypothetical protein